MKSYEIRIKIEDILHYSAYIKKKIGDETLLMLVVSFASHLRDMYITAVVEKIYSPRYRGEWEPVDEEGYLKYIGTEPTVPIEELFAESLEIREVKGTLIIRIDPAVKYPGSNLKLERVLMAIDNGTTKFNARTIIKPIVRDINRNIKRLWKRFLLSKGVF